MTGFIVSLFGRRGPWERNLFAVGFSAHKYIIVAVAERLRAIVGDGCPEAVMFASTRVDAYRRACRRFYRRDGSWSNR